MSPRLLILLALILTAAVYAGVSSLEHRYSMEDRV